MGREDSNRNLGTVNIDEETLGGVTRTGWPGLFDVSGPGESGNILPAGPALMKPHMVDWYSGKDSANPILTDTAGDHVGLGAIQFVDGVWHMWYDTADSTSAEIRHATSADGVNWTKDGSNPVLTGSQAWEGDRVDNASVTVIDGTYHMWYQGGSSDGIGYATSTDGSSWTKSSANPLVEPTETWEGTHVGLPNMVVREPGDYWLFYRGGALGDPAQIGVATGSEPDSLTKDSNNPILSPGSDHWESADVLYPKAYWTGQQFLIMYGGKNPTDNNSSIGFATFDGANVTRLGDGRPAIAAGDAWEGEPGEIEPGELVYGNGEVRLYYDAYYGSPSGIGVSRPNPTEPFSSGVWDDWVDNRLAESRPEVVAGLDGYRTYGRPEWTVESGSPSVSGQALEIPAGDSTIQEVRRDGPNLPVGRYEVRFQFNGAVSTGFIGLETLQNGTRQLLLHHKSGSVEVYDNAGGSTVMTYTHSADTSEHTMAMERNAYGDFELFFDGASVATGSSTGAYVVDGVRLKNQADASVTVQEVRIHR